MTLLGELTDYPIAAIVAPAGAGKTALVADWVARSGRRCGWLTIDPEKADAAGLASSLAGAVERLAPGSTGEPGGTILVVDDLDRAADDDATRAALTSFVEHRPPWLHLLLLSRRRPPLPVDRLRVSGDLADVDFGTLRFSEEEAALLLATLCPDLAADDLIAGVQRADGWVAALQLTALAVRSDRFVTQPSEHLAEKLVDEYLWEEVLGSERAERIELLFSAAVVGRINHGLAEALTERTDAGDLVEETEAAGLFLTPLPGGWFELHGLVADMLLRRLRRRHPDGLRKQHARAAQWFESVGDQLAALDHWLAAERTVDALRVLAELTLPLLEAGLAARAVAAMDRIGVETVSADPADAIRYAWCRLAAGPNAFLDALSVSESPALRRTSPSKVRTLEAVGSWLRADWRRGSDQARRALGEPDGTPGGAPGSDPVDRFGWRMVACGIALDERWDDRLAAVGQAWAACLAEPASRWFFEGTRALGLAMAGRPLDAARVADGARRAGAVDRYPTARRQLALADALVARELDHRDDARTALTELAETATYPDPVLQLVAQVELVRLRSSSGEMAAATAGLEEAERLHARLASAATDGGAGEDARPEVAPCSLVARAGVELALATDDPATAVRWSAHVSDPFWGPVCAARISLALGRHEEAEAAVRRARRRGPRHRVVAGLLLGQALAHRDRSGAEQIVADSLELAAAHGLLRTAATEGAQVMELIELAAWRVPDGWMNRLRHALVPTWTGQDAQWPVESLTDRERDVLRLLPSRLTLSEIAAELYVSQNTLKFHLRAIYRKLGAESRSQAVDSARRIRLLPRG